jgi:hypothetical protein
MRKSRLDEDGRHFLGGGGGGGGGVSSNARSKLLKVRRLILSFGYDDPRRIGQRDLEARPIGIRLIRDRCTDFST